jgi:surface protein
VGACADGSHGSPRVVQSGALLSSVDDVKRALLSESCCTDALSSRCAAAMPRTIWWLIVSLAASTAALGPAIVHHDAQRNVISYSAAIEAPNLHMNVTAQLNELRAKVGRLQGQMAQIADIDDCSSSPCINGGVCVDGLLTVSCVCSPVFTGARCEKVVFTCNSSPCHNGGTCSNGMNSFSCVCAPGFSGTQCESDVNECGSSPCRNGGTCTNGINSFSCVCAPGFSGTQCESDVNECGSSPCRNGGTCSNGINSFACVCAPGWAGTTCASNINDCSPNPCQNGGTCSDGINSFTCSCVPGFVGSTCETNFNECGSNPCQNGATCIDGVNVFSCSCRPGFAGTTCGTNINDCSPNPCLNGGTCSDGVNSYACACAPAFSGTLCELSACSSSPCRFGAVCSVSSSAKRPFVCSTFVTRWDTTRTSGGSNTGSGSSSSSQIRLPLEAGGTYNFVVQWGDGTSATITSSTQGLRTYATAGVYTVTITGTLVGWRFNNGGDRLKLLDVMQWGTMRLGNNGLYFHGVSNMVMSAVDTPDLTGTTNMLLMFALSSFNQPIDKWDVSSVTNMEDMFYYASSFNQPIGGWDVSSVTNMESMFYGASSFKQDISRWCVSRFRFRPHDFDTGTPSSWTTARKPKWGTCPPR